MDMTTESQQKALIAWLTQSISEELYNWVAAQRELGATDLPIDDPTWGIFRTVSQPQMVQRNPVTATSAPKTSPMPASSQTSGRPSGTSISAGNTSFSKTMASFQAMRLSQTAKTYDSLQERETALNIQKAHAGACHQCELGAKRQGILWGQGPADARMMFIAAGGNPRELEKNRILTDNAAELLDKIVQAMAQLHKDAAPDRIYMTNIIKCACVPPKNKVGEIARHCLAFLRQEIQIIRPTVIVVWGEMAHKAMFGGDQNISQVRGEIRYFDQIPVMTTHHPLEMLQNPKLKGRVWQDLQKAAELLK